MSFKALFILLFLCLVSCKAYKILVVLPSTFWSHYQFGMAISKALVASGHDVTVVSPFKQPKPLLNYREIHLELTQDAANASKSISYCKDIQTTDEFFTFSSHSDF